MLDQQPSTIRKTNRPLIITLAVMIITIFILAITIIIVKIPNNQSDNNEQTTGIRQEVPELYDDNTPDSSKAFLLSNIIEKKLHSDSNYNVADAINDYESVYQEFSGDLKVYIAIEYAFYVFNNTNDLERAIEILDIEDQVSQKTDLDYYNTLLNLYTAAGDQNKIEEYQQIVKEKTPIANPEDLY